MAEEFAPSSAPGAIRFAIIGCGAIAVNHAIALQALPGVTVDAVVDTDATRAREFAARFGIPRAFDDVDAALASGLDAVTVCTPHPAHEAGVVAAARHGLHVLCEKPVATTTDEADRMIAAADAAGVRFGVVFQRRFWPAAARIRAAIDSGALGAPIAGSCIVRLRRDAEYYSEPWRGRRETEGGGVLMTQAMHHIDLLQWFMGEAVSVTGRVATLRHGDLIDVEDTAVATVEFASGALAVVQAGSTFDPGLGAQVLVSDAAGRSASVLEFPEGTGITDVWTLDGGREFAAPYTAGGVFDIPLADIHRGLIAAHSLQIADFVSAVRDGRDPLVTGRDARRALEIVTAIYRSSETGVAVRLTGARSGATA